VVLASLSRAAWRKWLAEYLGTLFLSAIVVGSGIAAQTLSPHDTGLDLLENAAVTAAGLSAIILLFQPLSGAHFNPLVSLLDGAMKNRSWAEAWSYIPCQLAGAVTGSLVANAMFAHATFEVSTRHRFTWPHALAECVATFGLMLIIFGLSRSGRSAAVPGAVGAYIGAAYFFTSSTSFANPAITLGRMLSNSFAGIAPGSVLLFIVAQIIGAALALVTLRALYGAPRP
jgi:glycerol uptake facilitator-like aquaporin